MQACTISRGRAAGECGETTRALSFSLLAKDVVIQEELGVESHKSTGPTESATEAIYVRRRDGDGDEPIIRHARGKQVK